ncbi:redox-sensitive transcriptional activator SoxR [Sulfitobacter sp. HI0082]|jgi:MerR family redox-sensitive transcriptional activator SoxR|uniref:redox-sensitive transcriptional activator SoxR n=1 Tax=unclassified Sulfitobacter TaxID=196795 RepID=UPI0007C24E85|nr:MULTISPECIES: redox-sensitive transcriptional activator SoxR [unclassified Sulfitobacter]KZZ20083.1 redox-sensitive transcriptional activator SoxR [Sulfitobacter sp. HI0082]KZX98770.1 redox-sensitive transcriptional activator SoxR [Sulfitobacter sp. HI0021]KZX99254.1 redox-sensitive transcriptional activator SoxR [Sulfitobacter sp. HI0027]KZZ03440.1 redox-sensitive transcriptional activator SoxR [Sulfitobacter sp. HI0076]MAP14755.1 redox-sensitive transcriptional activator SoxR [Sulfitobact|tara:strand:+ start:887 stop:1342 length:456 start_codon:yes stop_codon:yes gene_type:complete
MAVNEGLSIGALAKRTGLAVSAIRYYEAQGLIAPWRNAGGQRRFDRADLRRLSFVMIAQQFGFTLPQIKAELDRLPGGRTPTKADWTRISEGFRAALDARIATLNRLRDNLDGCIGCGCLSLEACALYNPIDQAGEKGPGPRYLMGDEPAA